MINPGEYFSTPLRQNEREWKKLQWIIVNGWDGCNWPVRSGMKLLEVQTALREWRETSEKLSQRSNQEEALKEQKRAAAWRNKHSKGKADLELERQREYQENILAQFNRLRKLKEQR